MRIAYIGPAWGTSLHRARALERLGNVVSIVDPWVWLARPTIRARLHFHTGYAGVDALVGGRLFSVVRSAQPELVWVNQGEFLGEKTIRRLRTLGVPIINYANDNPFSRENRRRFRNYRAALPYYDLVVVVFSAAVQAARQAGARRVMHSWISADEVAHCPREVSKEEASRYASEVAFVGTWMKAQRGPFMVGLIRRGVPLSIWGDRWKKSREWPMVRPHWRGPGVYDDNGYASILQSAKICLGLVNKSSGNQHTDRSIQIPALGGLLCAERTPEHLELYREGEEAVFWENVEECAALCKELLADEPHRREIARRGHERALKNGLYNEVVMEKILNEAQRVFQEGR